MKNILKLTLLVLLFFSCKESPESSDSAASKNMEGLMREVTGKNANKDQGYARLMEELLTKTRLTEAEFLEAFPKKLGSLNLDEPPKMLIGHNDMASNVVAGNFGNGTIHMTITDAVGQNAGLAVLHLKSYDLMNYESDDNTKYKKKERNGILTSGVYVTGENESELKFLYDNRFYVELKGKGMEVDELWDAMGVDNLSRFKDFNK